MTAIEGWPYAEHPQRGRDLQTRWHQAAATLKKADARMRRAFHAWEKARDAMMRIEKTLEKGDA